MTETSQTCLILCFNKQTVMVNELEIKLLNYKKLTFKNFKNLYKNIEKVKVHKWNFQNLQILKVPFMGGDMNIGFINFYHVDHNTVVIYTPCKIKKLY